MQRLLVERSPRGDSDWTQVGFSMSPVAPWGIGAALWDGESVTIIYGWDDGVPRVWLDDPPTPLADLREGPFELDGPNARWRWSLITDAA